MIQIQKISSESVKAKTLRRNPASTKLRIRVHTGDVASSRSPATLEALLGSCVAVCLHDPVAAVGGMNHILLPGANTTAYNTRFGIHAMELLINKLMGHGAERKRLIAKAFGGANVLPGMDSISIGNHNASFVCEFLARERIPLIAQRLGGCQAVNVLFRSDTGKAIVRTVDGSRLSKILRAETVYWRSHSGDRNASGEITLF